MLSTEISLYLLFISFCLALFYLTIGFIRPRKYPPGPQWLPIIGNTLEIKKLTKKLGGHHHAFNYLANLYKTNVLGLKLGREYYIVVFTEPLMRQVMIKEEFHGRPDSFFIRLRSMGTRKGITMTDGAHWEEQRTFALKHLRDLGFGKTLMEDLIIEELKETVEKHSRGGEVQWLKVTPTCVINVLWALVAGSRFSPGDPQLEKLMNLMNKRSTAFDMAGGILSQIPWLRYIAPDYSGYNIIKNINSGLSELLMKTITEHKKTLNKGVTRDFIDAFLHQMNLSDGKPTTFTDDQLIMVCLDFFIAGSQTSSNTLNFAFLNILLRPNVQKLVHEEIDRVLPDGKYPSLSDRIRLPYTEAVLHESQRLCHVAPIGGPRRVLHDTCLDGYFIPQGTTVLLNTYHFHHDKEKWTDPESFRPERHLDADGKFSPEQIYLFSYGKRRCLGETLARNFLFLFFVGILKHFNFSLTPGNEIPTLQPNYGITLSPKPYSMIVTPRLRNGQ